LNTSGFFRRVGDEHDRRRVFVVSAARRRTGHAVLLAGPRDAVAAPGGVAREREPLGLRCAGNTLTGLDIAVPAGVIEMRVPGLFVPRLHREQRPSGRPYPARHRLDAVAVVLIRTPGG
jgi:hypothetical protein